MVAHVRLAFRVSTLQAKNYIDKYIPILHIQIMDGDIRLAARSE